ncbi:hypothetical protein LPC10_01065 [Methylorubrum sp. B1-46]|uniref:hypothetical protein n=1 Tax=Methylorubrum sp. B1-46 TaxID=2897334 RepID=UPI0007C90F15|nr:hypothetical protein [Methylorubrum sp. B1-46]OAH30266.1 hypothetical protein AX289_31210 [Methylorubrum populi]UGB26245.1 hypothetical protein LPC10_01065 [Methylorubrum sp. B1-46]
MSATALSPPPTSMPGALETYRAFLVARNGRVTGMVPLQAASEDEARLLAHELVEEEDVVELWAGLRSVARFEGSGRRGPPS